MSSASSDFVTVDLRGMKAALVARARADGVGLSTIVRRALARELALDLVPDASTSAPSAVMGRAIKVSIRLTAAEAAQLVTDAGAAGLSRGAYVGGLVLGIAVTAQRRDHVAALTATCAELSTLSRNIHHLTTLLRQDSVLAAREYREMLRSLKVEVRRHLKVVADALADLRPRYARAAGPQRGNETEKRHA